MSAEKLEEALVSVVLKAVETAGKAADFVVAQVPDIAQQYIAMQIAIGVFMGTVWLLLTVISIVGIRKFIKTAENHGGSFAVVALSIAMLLFSVPFMVSSYLDAVKAYVAPKVVLIDWSIETLKKAKK